MTKLPAIASAVALMLLAATAPASGSAAPPARTTSLTVYGNDPCPKGEGDEIVVCAREPESERYRIPKRFRQKPADESSGRSWSDRVPVVEEASRPRGPTAARRSAPTARAAARKRCCANGSPNGAPRRAEASEVP